VGPAAIASLIVHAVILAPVALGRIAREPAADRIDQLVVFLVPPDRKTGGERHGQGVDWAGLVGSGGVTRDPLPPDPKPEQQLPLGVVGDPKPTEPEAPSAPIEETALSEIEVDSLVVRDPTSVAPVYPPSLLAKSVEGATFVHYVVDTMGRVDTTTISVIRTTHPEFALSVRQALAAMKFRPAIQSSRRVRQWVQQNFAFRISKPVPSDTT
jgi:TonB family protein